MSTAVENPYLPLIHRALPRLLALYNADPTDPLNGCGDRRYWAWKLIDFPNATYQSAAFGLAHLLRADLLPDTVDPAALADRIAAMIAVVPELADRHGGLAEALPGEGSFCVTGLVLGDCLGALTALDGHLEKSRRQALANGLAPLAEFLTKQDEHHGIISNHLASCALGMVRWAKYSGETSAWDRAALWIDRIRNHASPEGWMREYGGADPGYQSWCSSALAQIELETDRFALKPLLEESYGFLEAFAFPDGSFANGCGARMTRFLFPGGAELMASQIPAAARLARFAEKNVPLNRFVTLDAIDEPNLAPLFNDTVLAATHVRAGTDIEDHGSAVRSREFPQAKLIVRPVGQNRVAVINVSRGGWTFISSGSTDSSALFPEPLARDQTERLCAAARGHVTHDTPDTITIEADLVQLNRMLPGPAKFTVLRLLSLTAFRSIVLGNLIKRLLAWLLVTRDGKAAGRVRRRIHLQSGTVADEVISGRLKPEPAVRGFSPFHMASQGYWQAGDDSKT